MVELIFIITPYLLSTILGPIFLHNKNGAIKLISKVFIKLSLVLSSNKVSIAIPALFISISILLYLLYIISSILSISSSLDKSHFTIK